MSVVTPTNLLSLADNGTLLVGRQNEPVTGADKGGATYVFDQIIPSNGVLKQLEIFGGSVGGAVKIKRYGRSGNQFTFKDSHNVTLVAGVLNNLSLNIAVERGDYLGLYSVGNAAFTGNATTLDNPGYHYAGGDAQSFTTAGPSNGVRFEARLNVEHIIFDQRVAKNVEAAPATGLDSIIREYRRGGAVRAQIGLQSVDDQDPQAGFFRVHAAAHNSHFDLSTYQYGMRLAGFGEQGHTIECQLAGTDLDYNPEFSVRHRVGGPDRGARIQARNGADTIGYGLNFHADSDPHLWLEDHPTDTPATMGYFHPKATGSHVFKIGGNEVARLTASGPQVKGLSEAPEPAVGSHVIWQKEDGSADAGDLMVTINSGGVIVTALLVDYSEIAPPP